MLASGAAFAQDAAPRVLADAGPMIPREAIMPAAAAPDASGGASLAGYKQTIEHFLQDHAVRLDRHDKHRDRQRIAIGAVAAGRACPRPVHLVGEPMSTE